MSTEGPPYLNELARYVETNLAEPTALVAALGALLSDPAAYSTSKGEPSSTLVDFVQELVLTDRSLQRLLSEPEVPISRELIDGTWSAVWRGARTSSAAASFEYDVCISFAGADRPVAERIANAVLSNGMKRKVFYDEFENVTLWGEDLSNYLHDVYSKRSRFCLILFSHRYRQRAWTRHELRAALTRVLAERQAYVLPVALDEGAVPDEFASIGYWSFAPGDEQRIADATEEKINNYIGRHYLSVEEFADLLTRVRVGDAILDGFREGIKARRAASDIAEAQAMTAVALIATANSDTLLKPVRALIDLVLFDDGIVGDLFDDNGDLAVFGDTKVKRWMGHEGPIMLFTESWEDHLRPYKERWDAADSEVDDMKPSE